MAVSPALREEKGGFRRGQRHGYSNLGTIEYHDVKAVYFMEMNTRAQSSTR